MSDAAIDNRARLVGSVLAAGSWPQRERDAGAHRVHQQARLARSFSAPHAGHEAVVLTDRFLAGGGDVADLYAAALRSRWPTFEPLEALPAGLADGAWLEAVGDYYTATAIAAFHWADQDATWQAAAVELGGVLPPAALAEFFAGLLGKGLDRPVRLYPNLLYPAQTPLLSIAADAYTLILPPPPALGESPPWSYREGEDWILTQGCHLLGVALLQPQLAQLDGPRRLRTLHAVTTLFLAQVRDEATARAYQIQTARTAGVADLGAAVQRLRDHAAAPNGASLLSALQGPHDSDGA